MHSNHRLLASRAARLAGASAIVIASLLVGCSQPSETASPGPSASGTGAATEAPAATAAFPVTIETCGVEVTYEQPPERAVALDQQGTEILLKLGVGDKIVGTAYQVDTPPEELAEAYGAIPMLAPPDETLPHEVLLEAQPDFVYSMFSSFFTPDGSGEREELHALGIRTYLTEFSCGYGEQVGGVSFDLLFEEYQDLGAIFGVPDAAAALVAEQQEVLDRALDAATAIDPATTVVWFYSTYNGVPITAGPGLLPQHVSDLVGVKNVFDDAASTWPETSWDEVAARNPDVIILADLTRGRAGDSAADKIEFLKADPVTAELDAVKNDRFIVMPARYMDPSYASVEAVPTLVDGLLALG
ncbi:MAG: ABC transporter substrate-binding protein [Bifidobacteriaceae bacterium]|jgi:iron complex transport system substrate-binding protein|nr:ABC transporter substrate-binding protein [Bifidobacteriaceae bacterium]